MPTQIQFVHEYEGESNSRSMEGFDFIAICDIDETVVVLGGDCFVVSKLDYYRK